MYSICIGEAPELLDRMPFMVRDFLAFATGRGSSGEVRIIRPILFSEIFIPFIGRIPFLCAPGIS